MSKPTIKVSHLKITDHLILGITRRKNETGEETFRHFNLETHPELGWNNVVKALKEGEVNAAFVLVPIAMDLFHAGLPIKLILLGHKTGSVLVKNKAAKIETVADFKGKKVAVPYQLSVHNMLLHRLLTEHGLTVGAGRDVTLEVMAPSQMPQAVQYDEEGEIGGFIVAEPFGAQAVEEGYGEEMILSKDLWPNHPCCAFVVKDDLIENHPEAVQELADSLVKSAKFVRDRPSDSVKIGMDFLEQNEKVVYHVLREPEDRVRINNEICPVLEDLDKIQDYMIDKMNLMHEKIDLDKFVDSRFAKKAGAI